jgi:hypothetical protein
VVQLVEALRYNWKFAVSIPNEIFSLTQSFSLSQKWVLGGISCREGVKAAGTYG